MTTHIFLLTAIIAFQVSARAQQPAPSSPIATSPDLIPIIVADGKHRGESDLAVDIDASGNATRVTGKTEDPELFQLASKATQLFRYADRAGATGVHEHVAFLMGKDLHTVPPEYPPIARAAHVSGAVEMAAALSADGHVDNVIVLAGPPMLRGAAIDSLKKWTFPPAHSGGKNVPARAIVVINFAYGNAHL